MQAYEFAAKLENGTIPIPGELLDRITSRVKVIVLEANIDRLPPRNAALTEKAICCFAQLWIPAAGNSAEKKPMNDRIFLDTNILIYRWTHHHGSVENQEPIFSIIDFAKGNKHDRQQFT